VRGLEAEGGEFGVDGGVLGGLELRVVEDDVEFGGAGAEGLFGFSGRSLVLEIREGMSSGRLGLTALCAKGRRCLRGNQPRTQP